MSQTYVNDMPYGVKSSSVWAYNGPVIEGGPVAQTAAASSTATIDWSTGNLQELTLTGTGVTVVFANALPGQNCKLIVKQDATGSRTITTWPTAIRWAGGAAPTLTTAANKADLCVFEFDGTSFFGCGLFQNE